MLFIICSICIFLMGCKQKFKVAPEDVVAINLVIVHHGLADSSSYFITNRDTITTLLNGINNNAAYETAWKFCPQYKIHVYKTDKTEVEITGGVNYFEDVNKNAYMIQDTTWSIYNFSAYKW